MDLNIINEYLKYVKKSFLEFYKIIFVNKYQKSLIEPFLDKYILVRYNNETNYHDIKNPTSRISKELEPLFQDLQDDTNSSYLKSIYALFGYIMYIDDAIYYDSSKSLIDYLISDNNLKIPDITSKKDELNKWLRIFTKTKKEFFLNLENNEYSLKEQRIDKGLYKLKLEQNVKISYLYSDTAINKAFTTGTTYEDSLFVLYILASKLVLENAINLDFSRRYVLPLASSLMLKEKKQKRLLEILNNTLAKKYLEISINLSTYYEYKNNIDKLIKDGYLFSIVIDDTFNGDITELYLFSSIFIYKNSEFFDMIIDSKERIPARIVIL